MTLREKQSKFTIMVAHLIEWAYTHGYEMTEGDSFASSGHMPGSLHYIRLAHDFNVFRDGVWLRNGEEFTDLGEYWESLGGSWGGRFNDGNHFSLAHGGRK